MKRISLLLLFSFTVLPLFAQQTYNHNVFWGLLILADTITSRWKWEVYLQKRTQTTSPGSVNFFAAPHFFSVWSWLNYKLTSAIKLSFSPVAYFNSHVFYNNAGEVKPEGVKEFRLSGRLEHEQKFKWFNYSNRYSVEYRLRDLNYNGNYQSNWRLRYQVKLEKPLFHVLAEDKPLSVFVADEVFIQFGEAVRNNPNIFDQNRINVGAAYEVVKNVRFTVSYLNILQERISGKEIDNANALWIAVAFENIFSQFNHRR